MYTSKLIKIYQSLNHHQKSLLKKWVRSPIHNQHQDVVKLFDFIASKRSLTPRTLDKKLAFQFIYPNKPYDDLRLRHMMTIGVTILENFVCFIIQNKNPFEQHKMLIQYYNDQNLDKIAQQHIKKSKVLHSKQAIQNHQYYQEQYELEQLILHQNEKQQRIQLSNLQAIEDAHSISFIIETLQHACAAIAYQNLHKDNNCDFIFLPTILALIQQGKYDHIIAIQFYYHSYMSLAYPEQTKYFHGLKKLLFEQHTHLPIHEIKELHVIAFNFCIKKLNTGAEEYVQEVFDLFQYGLTHHILVENNLLSRFTYKNIITAALRLKKTAWTAEFIETYTPFLEVKYQKNYQHFAYAKLLYTQGDYAQTLQLLNQVEYDDLFLTIDAKIIVMKIFYEENSIDALDALLNSFYIYLQRKEIMGYHQNNYKNIVQLTRKLLYTAGHDVLGIKRLKEQIQTTSPLTERNWLLTQIEQLL